MPIKVDLLTPNSETAYERLLGSVGTSLCYASLRYRDFLQEVLVDSAALYLVAYEGERMVGALPAFLKRNSRYGNVLNSLPFYGSNGGVIVGADAPDPLAVRRSLVAAFHGLARDESAAVSVLVSNPLDGDASFYDSEWPHSCRDERIGQVCMLPGGEKGEPGRAALLMAMYHSKTRNCIRKAQKSEILVYHSGSVDALHFLAELHRENIEAIGGLAKPNTVFLAIRKIFRYDEDYRVYVAEKDGERIAGLLVFFFNRTAEYFTPATRERFRIYQPMSLLVYQAMQEAGRRGCLYWNWGGTWLTQDAVYQFKSRWGTVDLPYFYYVREYEGAEKLRRMTPEQIRREYPYFFVLPFRLLGPA